MTFTLAAVILLAVACVALGLLAYHLFSRLHLLEEAVGGGLKPPSRTLSREEFARRYAVARERAVLARDVGTGVVLFLDDGATSRDILQTLHHLASPRGFTLAYRGNRPGDAPELSGARLLEDLGSRVDSLGVPIVPYGLVIDESAIVDGRPLGSAAALDSFLLELT